MDGHLGSKSRMSSLKRSGDVDDVARAAIFLATNDLQARFRVDGGELLSNETND
jgi:NAD(P)-dependent dehydrogenase (short-subunit alcohol dehydrogenase family)